MTQPVIYVQSLNETFIFSDVGFLKRAIEFSGALIAREVTLRTLAWFVHQGEPEKCRGPSLTVAHPSELTEHLIDTTFQEKRSMGTIPHIGRVTTPKSISLKTFLTDEVGEYGTACYRLKNELVGATEYDSWPMSCTLRIADCSSVAELDFTAKSVEQLDRRLQKANNLISVVVDMRNALNDMRHYLAANDNLK